MKQGCYTALITPFNYGSVDEQALENLIERQIHANVAGIVACGTTGESPNLTIEEYENVIELVVKHAKGKAEIFVGAGGNSTAKSIAMCNIAEEKGADGVMIVAPYYNKPGQEGLFQHFKSINDNISLPIMIYNHPYRCGVNINDETLVRLADLKNVKAVKNADQDTARVLRIYNQCRDKFYQYAGDDQMALAYNANGAKGVISVAANIFPEICVKIQDLWFSNMNEKALELQNLLLPLYDVLSCETNPVPIKYASSLLGLCMPDVRLPLVPLSERNKKLIRTVLEQTQSKLEEYQNEKYSIAES